MLIETDLLHFCARQTLEISDHYEKDCIRPGEDEGFPRSADDLDWIMQGRTTRPIQHKRLAVSWKDAKYRSFYIPYGDRIEIWYASGMSNEQHRFYKCKELLQIHLWQESLKTTDVVDLVRNMILRASPASIDLNLGHPATSDTLGELAAMQFLFPVSKRVDCLEDSACSRKTNDLAEKYGVPPFVIQRSLNDTEALKPFFLPC